MAAAILPRLLFFYVSVALLTLPFFLVFSVLFCKGRVISVIFNIF